MMDVLARFFRMVNAHLITTNSRFVRRFLKIVLLISYYFNKRFQKLGSLENTYVIKNFDHDLKLRIDRSREMGSSLFWTGFHEFKELMYLNRFLKPNMVALDVGANLGEYTLFMAKRLPQGKVIAFEPFEKTRVELKHNCTINHLNNIDVKDYGLGVNEELVTLYEIDDTHEGLSTAFPADRTIRNRFEIQLKSLDDELDVLKLNRLDFIKIDIEGGELFALQGSMQSLKQYRPLVMIEINDYTYKAAGYTSKDVNDFFTGLNYRAFQVNRDGNLNICSNLPAFGNVVYKAD
jgi:FkbM family methyltransferase